MMSVSRAVVRVRWASRTALGWRAHDAFGGLIVGVSASLVFPLLLLGRLVVPIAIIVTFSGGAVFAQLVAGGRNERAGWRRTILVGVILPLAGFGGLQFAAALEPLGITQPDAARLLVFRVAFVGASAIVSFVCTLVASWAFGLHGGLIRALTVAGVTAWTYLLYALVVDPNQGCM